MSNVYRLSDYRRQPRVGELNGLLAAYTGGRITRMQFRRMAASRLGYKRHELNHILRDLASNFSVLGIASLMAGSSAFCW